MHNRLTLVIYPRLRNQSGKKSFNNKQRLDPGKKSNSRFKLSLDSRPRTTRLALPIREGNSPRSSRLRQSTVRHWFRDLIEKGWIKKRGYYEPAVGKGMGLTPVGKPFPPIFRESIEIVEREKGWTGKENSDKSVEVINY